jgi:hypothetical protein
VGQAERHPVLQIFEEGPALTKGNRADHDPQLVEDARGSEAGGEVGAANHEQLAAGAVLTASICSTASPPMMIVLDQRA